MTHPDDRRYSTALVPSPKYGFRAPYDRGVLVRMPPDCPAPKPYEPARREVPRWERMCARLRAWWRAGR